MDRSRVGRSIGRAMGWVFFQFPFPLANMSEEVGTAPFFLLPYEVLPPLGRGRVTHGGEAARVYKTYCSHKSVCPDPRTTMHLINR